MLDGAKLGDEFTTAIKALDVIEHRLPFIVDQDELGDAMCTAVELGNRVDALQAKLAYACTLNKVAAVSGQRSIGQYVAARTNSRGVGADQSNRIGKWLRDFPVFEAAHGRELTNDHVLYLRKHLDGSYATHCKLIADQQFFVDTAASCSFEGFTVACESWLVHIDPDGKEPADQIEKSSFRVGKGQGGRGEITGTCDAVTAQSIRTAVEHEANKLRKQDKENGIERTETQRRMAALASLVKRGFARDDGTYPVPLGNIVMSQSVAEWALAQLNGEADPHDLDPTVPVHPTDVDGRCELIDGTPIHPFLAVAALGLVGPAGAIPAAKLRRYVMDADSRLLDVSVNARSFPEWMRTALLVQSRGKCDTPGCEAPDSWLEIDHVDPVTNGGETRMDNGQPQCRPDNQAKGAATGHIPWRDRKPPPRRSHRRPNTGSTNDDPDDPDTPHTSPGPTTHKP